MKRLSLFAVLMLAACAETAWNTTIADTPERRRAMAASVDIGNTTEKDFITRWGAPTQRVREGGQTEFIYRTMSNPSGYYAPRFGDSANYVIVTFQYGRAVGVRTSESEGCRATFPPWPPGPGFPHLTTVHPAATCAGVRPPQGRVHPLERAVQGLLPQPDGSGGATSSGPPMVPADRYEGGGKAE